MQSVVKDSRRHLPAVISANAPHSHRVNRLCIEHGEILRVYQLQSALVQVHEQVFALASSKLYATQLQFRSDIGIFRYQIGTNVTPSPNDVQKVVSTKRQVHDAFIHSLAASFRRQILLSDLCPAKRAHRESDGLVSALGVCSCGVAPSPKGQGTGKTTLNRDAK